MSTDWVERIHIWIQVCFYQHILNSDQLTPVWTRAAKEKENNLFKVRFSISPEPAGAAGASLKFCRSVQPSFGQVPRGGRFRTAPLRGRGTFCATRRSTCCNRIRRPLSHMVWPCSFSRGPPLFLRRFRYAGDRRRRAALVIGAGCILRVAVVLGALLRSSFEKRRSFDPFVPHGPTQLCSL